MISEAQQDQAALYALGALDADEAVAFEREMHANSELRDLAADFRDAAASLSYAAPTQSASRGLRDRVLSEIALEKQEKAEAPRSGRNWLPWAIAAVLAISAGALLLDRARVGHELQVVRDRLRQTLQTLGSTREELQVANRKLDATIGQLEVSNRNLFNTKDELEAAQKRDPFLGASFYSLAPTPDGVKTSRATVAWQPERQSGFIKIANLPKPQRGRDYQLWAVDANHKAPVSAGIVHVNEKGEAEVRFRPTEETREVKAFAISIEREGGSSKKEGPIILVGTA